MSVSSLPADYPTRAQDLQLDSLDTIAAILQNKNDPNVYVLDIRSSDEIASTGHVQHSNWMQCSGTPTENEGLSNHPEGIVPDKTATIIVYCASGRRANKAKEILLEKGYTGTILNAGGYNDIQTIL